MTKNLQAVLSRYLVAMAILPMLLCAFGAAVVSWPVIEEDANRLIRFQGNEIAEDIETYCVEVETRLLNLGSGLPLQVTSPDSQIHELFDGVVERSSFWSALYVLDAAGRVRWLGLPQAIRGERQEYLGYDLSRFCKAPDGDSGIIWTDPKLSPITGQPKIFVSYAVGSLTLMAELSLERLQKLRDHVRLNDKDEFAIFDRHGRLIMHSDLSRRDEWLGRRFAQAALLGGRQSVADGCAVKADFAPLYRSHVSEISATGWTIWFGRPAYLARMIALRQLSFAGPVLLPVALMAILAGMMVSRRLGHPLQRLSERIQRLTRGNLDNDVLMQHVDSSGYRELDELTMHFQEMQNAVIHRERSLAEGEALFRRVFNELRAVFDGIPESLVWLDTSLQVRWANRAAADTLGLTAGMLLGRHCRDLECRGGTGCEFCPVTQAQATQKPEEGLVRIAGERVLAVKAFPMTRQGNRDGVVRLVNDVTEKMQMRQEILRNNRLQALGELSAGIAHEINNPIGLILWQLPMLQEVFADMDRWFDENGDESESVVAGLPLQEVRQALPEMFTSMLDGANRIREIVQSLKEFTRGSEDDALKRVDLNEAVAQSVKLTHSTLVEATECFSMQLAAEPLWVLGDLHKLEQVIINLLINACEALESRSAGVRVQTAWDPEKDVNVITIEDAGAGIPADVLEHIRDPFFTTKRAQGGTGLGLSISTRIIQKMHGRIEFKSRIGAGTIVCVELPNHSGEPS